MSLAWFGVHGKFLQWPESLPERSCIISVQVLLAMCRGQGPPKEALTAMHSHQATQIGMLTRQRASTLMLFDPCGSTQQAFKRLAQVPDAVRDFLGAQPGLLLLGGGMAAGKSTVREVIGHDDFWSKVC